MAENFPAADPRLFLENRIRDLYEQSELIKPGVQHTTAEYFEGLSHEFLAGDIPAEHLCLYTMIMYIENEKALQGTEAGANLWTFSRDFANYVPINNNQMLALWDDARTHVAQKERLKRVKEKMEGKLPMYSTPVKVLRLSQGADGELEIKQIHPPPEQ